MIILTLKVPLEKVDIEVEKVENLNHTILLLPQPKGVDIFSIL